MDLRATGYVLRMGDAFLVSSRLKDAVALACDAEDREIREEGARERAELADREERARERAERRERERLGIFSAYPVPAERRS